MSEMRAVGAIPRFDLPDRLRKARDINGWSQEQLAEHMGIDRSTVTNHERGHTRPNRLALKMYAMATGVDYQWLVTGEVGNPDDGPGLPWPDSNGQPSGSPSPQVGAIIPMPRRLSLAA